MRLTIPTAALAFGLSGCALEDRFLLEVPVVAGGTGIRQLDAGDGATIALDEASVTFSDLRLEEPPTEGMASLLSRLSPIQAAWAHPGHDYPGDVAGELLGTFTVDLLGEDQPLGLAPCYEGEYATGRIGLSGTVAVLAGVYRDGAGAERSFRFEVEADQAITAIPFDEIVSASAPPERLELRFDLWSALKFTDWSVPDADGDALLTMADPPYDNTVRFGVVATPTWSLSLVP